MITEVCEIMDLCSYEGIGGDGSEGGDHGGKGKAEAARAGGGAWRRPAGQGGAPPPNPFPP